MSSSVFRLATRVPICITPIPGESVLGFLARTAAANFYPSPSWLWKSKQGGGFDLGVWPSEARSSLASMVGIEPKKFDELCYTKVDQQDVSRLNRRRFFSGEINGSMLLTHFRNYCPDCLREGRFHPAIFDIRYLLVCPVHRHRLQQQCPHCFSRIGWSRSNMSICHRCEGDLRQAADISASPSEINATFLILEKCGARQCYGEQLWPKELARFSIGESIEFLGALEKLNFISRNFERPAGVKKGAAHNLSSASRLLENWPENLFRMLDLVFYNRSLANGDNGSFLELNRVGFIKTIRDQFMRCSSEPASALDESLTKYLFSVEEDYRNGRLDARFADMRGSERTSIRISELADRSGPLSGSFEDIASYNKARKAWTRQRFKNGSLRRDETEIIFEQELLTMCQSARFLGVSRTSLRGLIARRIIVPAKFRTCLGTHTCFFPQADVQATINAIHSRLLPSPAAPGNLDFRAMLLKVRVQGVRLGDVLHSIVSGNLAVRGWNDGCVGLNCASFNDREIEKAIDLLRDRLD